jgi:hypothetical protein
MEVCFRDQGAECPDVSLLGWADSSHFQLMAMVDTLGYAPSAVRDDIRQRRALRVRSNAAAL